MNAANFDRWVLCLFVGGFAAIAVYGMRLGNAGIIAFGKDAFTLFSGALLLMLNRELLIGNGAGNGNAGKNGSGPENPTRG